MGKSTAAPANPYEALQIHECCALIDPMTDEEMARVSEDIRRHGLRNKILKHGDMILDGRTRWIILKNLGVTLGPEHFEEWDGRGDIFDLVMSLNAHRRHLEPGSLAKLAAIAKKRLAGTVPDARAAAAKQFGVAPAYVSAYERIEEADPEVAREVAAGKATIPEAKRRLGLASLRGVSIGNEAHGATTRRVSNLPGRTLIDIKDPERPTRLEDIVEDHEERRAIQDDVSDEAWACGLPLASQLDGKVREMFLADAMAYRLAEAARKAYGAVIGGLVKGNRRSGPWLGYQERALACNPPEDWEKCPPVDQRKCRKGQEPGCGGAGETGFGNETARCERCWGSGYTVR